MADFKFTLPTSSSLIKEARKKYDDSFQKKVTDSATAFDPNSNLYTQHNQGLRFQLEDSRKTLFKAGKENLDALRKSDLSAEEKKEKKAQLQEQAKKINAELTASFKKKFIELRKKRAKK